MSPYYLCDMKHSLTSHKIIITLNTNKQANIHEEKENNTRKGTWINDNSDLPYSSAETETRTDSSQLQIEWIEVHHKVGNFSKEDNTIFMFIITFYCKKITITIYEAQTQTRDMPSI
jgi:hypothetical protein